jgi:hypothetical protein
MSLQEAERRRHRSDRDHRKRIKRRKKTEADRKAEQAKREAERARIAQYQNPNQVLTFWQWCLLNSLSPASGRRIINSGTGPIITELGPRRIAVAVTKAATLLTLLCGSTAQPFQKPAQR